MKYFICVITILIFINCKKTDNKNIKHNEFVISIFNEKNDKFVEALVNNDTAFFSKNESEEYDIPMPEPIDKRLNLKYNIGNIHFMILDTSITYFYINSLEHKFTCGGMGNYQEMSKKDSINYIIENSKQIPFSKKINTNQISDILNKYKKEIINDNGIPLMISFSSKYDTIKGDIIPNLFTFMEKNGMKYYFIRKFNDAEINANFK